MAILRLGMLLWIVMLKSCDGVRAVDKGIEIRNVIMSKRLLEDNIELGNAFVDRIGLWIVYIWIC